MKLNILQIICLINYVVTFPNDLFDELWQINQSEPQQANNNPIESQQQKIKVEPREDQFDKKWPDESALKGIVKVEHKPHYGTVKLEGWWDEQSGKFTEQFEDHVKEEEVQDGQAPNASDHKKIADENDENWSEDKNNSAQSADDIDQENSKEAKHLFDQHNSTDQDESVVDKQQNKSNECENIEFDQQKHEIIQKKFREVKDNGEKNWRKSKFSEFKQREILKRFDELKSKCKQAKFKNNSSHELDEKIAKKLGVSRTTINEWNRKLGLSVSKRCTELEKRNILKRFDLIKSKCKQAKLENISMYELDEKIANKLGVCRKTITLWKRKFGLSSISKKDKFSVLMKIAIVKKYAKIKRNIPKMRDCDIADLLKISKTSLRRWKAQFREENMHH